MSRSLASLCLVLLCLLLLVPAGPARAQTDIHHCVGANGGAVFTDQPCSALNATPVSAAAAASPAPRTVSPTAPLPVLCAASVDELRQSLIDAFTGRDTIRMGGLILWDGYGSGAVIADIRALSALMKHPLLDVDVPQPATSSAPPIDDQLFAPQSTPPPPPSADQMVLHTGGVGSDDAASTWRFDIVRQAGCLWLRNAN